MLFHTDIGLPLGSKVLLGNTLGRAMSVGPADRRVCCVGDGGSIDYTGGLAATGLAFLPGLLKTTKAT